LSLNEQFIDLFNEAEEEKKQYIESMRKTLEDRGSKKDRVKSFFAQQNQQAKKEEKKPDEPDLSSKKVDLNKNMSSVGFRVNEIQKRNIKMMSFLKILQDLKPHFDCREDNFSQKNIRHLLWRVFSFHV
jgi:hypothetical protein